MKTFVQNLLKQLLFVSLLLCVPVKAEINHTVGVDMGVSIPYLTHGSVQVLIWEHWQIGLSYGLIPGLTAAQLSMALPEQTIAGPAGLDFTVRPKIALSFNTLSPFIRYFPHRNNFYMQFSYAMFNLYAKLNGAIAHPILGSFPDNALQGNFVFTQPLPTFSVGYIFSGKYGFFNLNIGATIFYNPTVTGSITGVLPDDVMDEAQVAFDQMAVVMSEQLATVATSMRSSLPYLPSIMLSWGFFF